MIFSHFLQIFEKKYLNLKLEYTFIIISLMINLQGNDSFSQLQSQQYQLQLQAPGCFLNPPFQQEKELNWFNCLKIDHSPVIVKFISNNSFQYPVINQNFKLDQCQKNGKEESSQISQQMEQQGLSQQSQKPQIYSTQLQVNANQEDITNDLTREDDSNNGPKKMITSLNKSLTQSQNKRLKGSIKQIKEKIKVNNGVKFDIKKASRYGFINQLSCIKILLSQNDLSAVFQSFKKKLQEYHEQKAQQTKADQFLKMLTKYYIKSFDCFLSGDIQKAVTTIYEVQKFKQEAYRNNGVRQAKSFYDKLISLK